MNIFGDIMKYNDDSFWDDDDDLWDDGFLDDDFWDDDDDDFWDDDDDDDDDFWDDKHSSRTTETSRGTIKGYDGKVYKNYEKYYDGADKLTHVTNFITCKKYIETFYSNNVSSKLKANNNDLLIIVSTYDDNGLLHSNGITSSQKVYNDYGLLLVEDFHYHGILSRLDKQGVIIDKPSRLLYDYYGLFSNKSKIRDILQRLYIKEEIYLNKEGNIGRETGPSHIKYEHNLDLPFINYDNCNVYTKVDPLINNTNNICNVTTNNYISYSCYYKNGIKHRNITENTDEKDFCEVYYDCVDVSDTEYKNIIEIDYKVIHKNNYINGNLIDGINSLKQLKKYINRLVIDNIMKNDYKYLIDFK